MSVEQIIEVWKDPAKRGLMSEEEAAAIPEHPAGAIAQELDESELALIAGGGGLYYCGCGNVCSLTTECGCVWGISVCKNNYGAYRCYR